MKNCFFIILLLPLFIGCASLFPNNYRTFVKENLWAQARLQQGAALYHSIGIGNPKYPFDRQRPLYVKFKDGNVYSVSNIQREFIASVATQELSVSSDYGAREWENLAEYVTPATLYIIGSYKFVFSETDLISFIAYVGAEISVDGAEFLELPISQSDVERIFGAPDSLRDYFLM